MLINLLIELDLFTSKVGTKYIRLNKYFRINILPGNTIIAYELNYKGPFEACDFNFEKEILINSKIMDFLKSGDQLQQILAIKLIERKLNVKLLNDGN